MAVAPNGLSVLTATDDGHVKLWSTETGEYLQTFRGLKDPVPLRGILAGRPSILAVSRDNTAELWSPEAGECPPPWAQGHRQLRGVIAGRPFDFERIQRPARCKKTFMVL